MLLLLRLRRQRPLLHFPYHHHHHSPRPPLPSPRYRGPEVILNLGWSCPSDLWSVGCIISELFHGELLFATHSNTEHLALMSRCCGPFPASMIKASQYGSKYFDRDGRSRWVDKLNREGQRHVLRMPTIEALTLSRDAGGPGLTDLLVDLLQLDPRRRPTASWLLDHNDWVRSRPKQPGPAAAVSRSEQRD